MSREHDDPRMEEPGSRGMPGSLDDDVDNLPGDNRPPLAEDVQDESSPEDEPSEDE